MPSACWVMQRNIADCSETCQRHVPTWWRNFALAYCGRHNSSHLSSKRNWGLFLFALSDNLISKYWFFAVKRRAVFILGAKWIALVRGWRRDCVVGGMETRFQWRKTHSRTAKCEAFHVAPRLFFMFLFLIPFTTRQQYIIYPQEFSTDSFSIGRPKEPSLWCGVLCLVCRIGVRIFHDIYT